MNSDFRAVEEPHGYFLRSKPLPSPSSVFADLGLVDSRFYTASGRARGKAVHGGLHFALKGTLDWSTLHQDLHGYVKSGLLLVDRLKPTIRRFETSLYHPSHLFAGTFDVDWELDGWPWIIDWKSGKAHKVARYQLAAYEMLARFEDEMTSRREPFRVRPYKRAAVELQEDGSIANLVRYEDHTDGAAWLSLLSAFRIRQALRAGALVAWPQGE